MTIEWTYEHIFISLVLLFLLAIFFYWSEKSLSRIGLIIAIIGLFFAILQPTWVKYMPLIGSYAVIPGDSEVSEGIYGISAPNKAVEGEEIRLMGKLLRDKAAESRLVFISTSGEEQELSVNKGGDFTHKWTAGSPGLYEFELKFERDLDTLTEVIAIEVEAAKKLNMLIYASSPNFEFNYLKNHWKQEGHGVVQRVKVAREKYNTSFTNIAKFNVSTWSPSLLARFDLVLMDVGSWNAISKLDRGRILAAVSKTGLGLLLQADEKNAVAKSLPRNQVRRSGMTEFAGVDLSELVYENSRSWASKAYGHYYPLNFGNVVLLAWTDTYKLLLTDQVAAYNSHWTQILNDAYTVDINEFSVRAPRTATAGHTETIDFYGLSRDDVLLLDSTKIKLMRTPFLEGHATAKVQPRAGWNTVTRSSDASEARFYSGKSTSWKTIKEMRVRKAITELTAKNEVTTSTYTEKREIPFWISLLLVSLGFGILWVSEKLG